MRKLAIGLLILIILAVAVVAKVYLSYQNNAKGSAGGAPVAFTVPAGASLTNLGPSLAGKGVIDSTLDFHVYLRLHGISLALQKGDYTLRKDMPYSVLIAALSAGPSQTHEKVTIPEGLTVTETAQRVGASTHIAAADFQAAATVATTVPKVMQPGITSLEGFLYPQTYFVAPKETAAQLVTEMVDQFQTETAQVNFAAAPGGVTPYQVVVIASLIQNEAKVASDGPKIAAVIYNRLRTGMTLGIDATIYYGLNKSFGQPLTQSDLATVTPYNTRLKAGLPPTPISSPELPFIQDAVSPAQTNDLYYVLGPDCKTNLFFSSYNDFVNAAKRQPTTC
ncbi:MAG TPA: endolytic transglycosylase MltG [Actinomycetota bacterium]|nr:endolytic transglycosylase MltG [Actinomycetota bacterium]